MRRYITAGEAITLLPDKEEIHTFYQMGMTLVGADWSRKEIINKLKNSDMIEITGTGARDMGHGLAAYDAAAIHQSDILFIETDDEKLDAFDPKKPEMTNKQAIEYIDSIMNNYDVSNESDPNNPSYKLCKIWLGEHDLQALEMAKEALRRKDDSQ